MCGVNSLPFPWAVLSLRSPTKTNGVNSLPLPFLGRSFLSVPQPKRMAFNAFRHLPPRTCSRRHSPIVTKVGVLEPTSKPVKFSSCREDPGKPCSSPQGVSIAKQALLTAETCSNNEPPQSLWEKLAGESRLQRRSYGLPIFISQEISAKHK
jgi:hypothetical protein